MVNPLVRQDMPPRNARGILDRLNEIGFNASVVLEINAIEAVNRVLADLDAVHASNPTHYKPVRFHLMRDDRFLAEFGLVSKSSTSWALIDLLFRHGRAVADRWLASSLGQLGRASSCDVHTSWSSRCWGRSAARWRRPERPEATRQPRMTNPDAGSHVSAQRTRPDDVSYGA